MQVMFFRNNQPKCKHIRYLETENFSHGNHIDRKWVYRYIVWVYLSIRIIIDLSEQPKKTTNTNICIRATFRNWVTKFLLGSNYSFMWNKSLFSGVLNGKVQLHHSFWFQSFPPALSVMSVPSTLYPCVSFDVSALTLIMQFWWKQEYHTRNSTTRNDKVYADCKPRV